jgi:hypothetical protein
MEMYRDWLAWMIYYKVVPSWGIVSINSIIKPLIISPNYQILGIEPSLVF